MGRGRGARSLQVNLRVDKPRALILAWWPMPPGVHPRMLARPDLLLLSQSHRGPTFETQAPGPLSSLRAPVQGHRRGCESGAGCTVRGRLEIEGLGTRSSNENRYESMSAIRPAVSSLPAQALQLANGVRRARSVLKARVADGQLAAAEVILICPSEIASMPVAQLLASQRGWGEARSRAFLAQVAVGEDESIGSLTERQRRVVAALLTRTVACAELSSNPPRLERRRAREIGS